MIKNTDKYIYLADLESGFRNTIFKDINITLQKAKIAGLILMLCAIDCLKTYRYGLKSLDKTTMDRLKKTYPHDKRLFKYYKKSMRGTGYYYKKYIGEYFKPINKKYKPEDLWAIRCSLLHSYSELIKGKKCKYIFIFNKSNRLKHLEKNKGKLFFNIDIFYDDFNEANKMFFRDAHKNNIIKINIFNIKSFLGRLEFRKL